MRGATGKYEISQEDVPSVAGGALGLADFHQGTAGDLVSQQCGSGSLCLF